MSSDNPTSGVAGQTVVFNHTEPRTGRRYRLCEHGRREFEDGGSAGMSPATAPSATGGSGTAMRWQPIETGLVPFAAYVALATSEPAQGGEDIARDALTQLWGLLGANNQQEAVAALRDRPAAPADTLAALEKSNSLLVRSVVRRASEEDIRAQIADNRQVLFAALAQAEATSTVTPDRELDGKGEPPEPVKPAYDDPNWLDMSDVPRDGTIVWVRSAILANPKVFRAGYIRPDGIVRKLWCAHRKDGGGLPWKDNEIDAWQPLAHSTSTGGENAR